MLVGAQPCRFVLTLAFLANLLRHCCEDSLQLPHIVCDRPKESRRDVPCFPARAGRPGSFTSSRILTISSWPETLHLLSRKHSLTIESAAPARFFLVQSVLRCALISVRAGLPSTCAQHCFSTANYLSQMELITCHKRRLVNSIDESWTLHLCSSQTTAQTTSGQASRLSLETDLIPPVSNFRRERPRTRQSPKIGKAVSGPGRIVPSTATGPVPPAGAERPVTLVTATAY